MLIAALCPRAFAGSLAPSAVIGQVLAGLSGRGTSRNPDCV